MTMYSLDSNVMDLVNDPRCQPNELCRTTTRLRLRWSEDTMRDLLARPPQRAIVDALHNAIHWVGHSFDAELKNAIDTYLEKVHA